MSMPRLFLERTRNLLLLSKNRGAGGYGSSTEDDSSTTSAFSRVPLKSGIVLKKEESSSIETSSGALDSSPPSNKKSKKRVRFDENKNQFDKTAANSRLSALCWQTVEEGSVVKIRAQMQAQQVKQGMSDVDKRYRSTISAAFKACCKDFGDDNDDNDEEDSAADPAAIAVLSPKQAQKLGAMILVYSNSRLGLENVAVGSLWADSLQRRHCALNNVLCTQNAFGIGGAKTAEMIRGSVEPITRPSRI